MALVLIVLSILINFRSKKSMKEYVEYDGVVTNDEDTVVHKFKVGVLRKLLLSQSGEKINVSKRPYR